MKSGKELRIGALAVLVATTLSACGGGGGSRADSSPAAEVAAAMPDGDHLLFSVTQITVDEADRRGSVDVIRTGDASGATSISYRFVDGTAVNGEDYIAADGTLSWADGELGAKTISFETQADIDAEALEQFSVELFDLVGMESISGSAQIDVDVADTVCQQISGAIDVNTDWSAGCYHITETVVVSGQAQLHISAGATVIADAGTGITVSDTANIDIQGSSASPVVLKGASAAAGSWNGIAIVSANPLQQIDYAMIEGATIGLDMIQGAQLGSFNHNAISNTADAAIRLPTDSLHSLGTSLEFNDSPGGILLLSKTITGSTPLTLTAQSTHYSLSSSLIIDGVLVIEPGVEMRFAADTQIYVSQNGSLNAMGTQLEPIVVTGMESVAGYWNGIQFVSSSSSDNKLSHVTVAFGGGDPARAGNIIVDGNESVLSISDSVISDSAGYGLYQLSTGSDIQTDNVEYINNTLGDHVVR